MNHPTDNADEDPEKTLMTIAKENGGIYMKIKKVVEK